MPHLWGHHLWHVQTQRPASYPYQRQPARWLWDQQLPEKAPQKLPQKPATAAEVCLTGLAAAAVAAVCAPSLHPAAVAALLQQPVWEHKGCWDANGLGNQQR